MVHISSKSVPTSRPRAKVRSRSTQFTAMSEMQCRSRLGQEAPMPMERAMHFIFSAVLIGYTTFAVMPEAESQETGWITVFAGKGLDGWDQVGGSNWHVTDGGIVADTMADKRDAGCLVTNNAYRQFLLRLI